MPNFSVSKAAKRDILSIGKYTQDTWGRGKRQSYLDGMDQKFKELASNPERIRERSDFDPPVRIQQYVRHLIVYVCTDDGILIVRVLHERMQVAEQLADWTSATK